MHAAPLLQVQEQKDAESEKLAEEMRRLNAKQMESKVAEDISSVTAWAERFQADANHQGNLDVKYLAERYQRGCDFLARFSNDKHKYFNLELSHDRCPAEILKFAAGMRDSASAPAPILGAELDGIGLTPPHVFSWGIWSNARYVAMISEADLDDPGCNVLAWSFLGLSAFFAFAQRSRKPSLKTSILFRSRSSFFIK